MSMRQGWVVLPDNITLVDNMHEPLKKRVCASAKLVKEGGLYLECSGCEHVYTIPKSILTSYLRAPFQAPIGIEEDTPMQLETAKCPLCDHETFKKVASSVIMSGLDFTERATARHICTTCVEPCEDLN